MIGDSHNGGLAVRRVEASDGRFWFHKPRTVFWEHLFFGVSSPIKNLWSKPEALFRLQIECSSDFQTGKSLAINESNTVRKDAYFNFGYLLGYAHLFGIQDLFRENVVLTELGVLPIDTEIVFSKFFLPHESSLLPFKTIAMGRSGLGALLGETQTTTPEQVFEIVQGFLSVLNDAIRFSSVLLDKFEDLPLSKIPVRILLRPTPDYLGMTSNTWDFISEEKSQLDSGDVPYFFKYLRNDRVYFYASGRKQEVESKLPSQMQAGLKNLAVDPRELLDIERINQNLIPVGILFLLRKLLPSSYEGKFTAENFQAEIKSDSLEINVCSNRFSSKR